MTEKRTVLFALSTCNACKKTKDLLDRNNIDYLVVELDIMDINSRDKMLKEVRQFNPKETFPTLVINGGEKVVIGYRADDLRAAFHINATE